ncbi:Calcineurin-like_phosphoesterase superfamily domain-containing protein [Hexamita inflata]|uniref:Calcineurin-like phosphoesterase superfamily domain-containing protein n=1 Tax=Hexamita inflata TaxID=28002 RepID=A0AA86P650_9EUKA|nr:Calcineurin-like phosphoesterase superfamily domain-containing protein [Hexamita inflata]
MQFLNNNINADDEHVFIITHHPVYSTGSYGSNKYFVDKMEAFLDANQDKHIRAVFSGHDHLFASFKRGNQFVFVNGAGGGSINNMTIESHENRQWKSSELHGPLPYIDDTCMGYDKHLDSYLKFTRTEVELSAHKVTYTIRDLSNQKTLTTYDQNF